MSCDNNFEIIPTKAGLLSEKKIEFKSIVFKEPQFQNLAPKNTRKEETSKQKDKPGIKNSNVEFDIKKARHEVINFAISGQQPKNKRKLEILKAIKLGAKPPKKTYKNYKVLLEEKERAKKMREERLKFRQLGKNKVGAASVKCCNKRQREKEKKRNAPVNQIGKHYGVVNPVLKKKRK